MFVHVDACLHQAELVTWSAVISQGNYQRNGPQYVGTAHVALDVVHESSSKLFPGSVGVAAARKEHKPVLAAASGWDLRRRMCACRQRTPKGAASGVIRSSVLGCKADTASQPEQTRAVSKEQAFLSSMVAVVRAAFPRGEADWVVEADARRLLSATEGDTDLACRKLEDAVRWKRDVLNGWLAMDGEREMRVIGFGPNQQPVTYHCGHHQRKGESLPAQWASCWHKAIVDREDPFAQFAVIFDCVGFQPLLNLSVRPYIKLAPSLDSFFAERVHRAVVLDMPRIAEFLWVSMSPLLPPKTRRKVFFAYRKDPKSLEPLFDLCADDSMRSMLSELLRMNDEATNTTGRHASHSFTSAFVASQLAQEAEQRDP